MANIRKIKPVKDNSDKEKTYKEHIRKYNCAIRSECYFEALLITYAMLEDRLRSYLFYLGCLRTRSSYKFDNDKIRKDIKSIVDHFSDDKVNNLGITSITGKMRIVSSVQKWFENGYSNYSGSDYMDELASCLDLYGDPEEMLDTLTAIRDWCDYRNEVVHALLNKNLDSLYEDLPGRAKKGMVLVRIIDKHVGRLKSRNCLRKFLKMKEN